MRFVDLDRLAAMPVARDPFDHVIVPGFVPGVALPELIAAFPAIDRAGSFPIDGFELAPPFAAFVAELRAAETTAAFGRAFGLDLGSRPTMVTVRGRCRAEDGGVHTDSTTKIVTALIYLNGPWGVDGGRLRLLRSGDLDDAALEVSPDDGTLVAFPRSERSFHGHKPFAGPRRVVQLNWMRDAGIARRELTRHRWSARLKRLGDRLGLGRGS
jgi:hypothetical protein